LESEVLKELNNIDEAKVFLDAIENVRQSFGVNLISTVFDELPKKSKEYVERLVNDCKRHFSNSV